GEVVAGAGVIELAAVGELALGIEEEEIRGAGGLAGAGDVLGFGVAVGEIEAEGAGLLLEAFGAVFGELGDVVGRDGDDAEAGRGVVFADFGEFDLDVFDEGAVGANEHYQEGALGGGGLEGDGVAGYGVGKGEWRGGGAEVQHDGFDCG